MVVHKQDRKRGRTEGGFVLMTTAILLIALLALCGLAVDIGRMYITKNEAQAYADSAALSAAMKLDGTEAGIQAAKDEVAASNNKWRFNGVGFSDSIVEFSITGQSGWETNPSPALGFQYARVGATAQNLPLYLLPVVGTPKTTNITAHAVAGQLLQSGFTENSNTGILPFSPIAHSEGATPAEVLASDPTGNFGYTPGEYYTLRWPSNPRLNGNNANICSGDATQQWVDKANAKDNSERGYIQETSASAIRAAIEGDKIFNPVILGEQVEMTGGAKGTEADALANRILQDTDSTTLPYWDYVAKQNGNGRRVVTVAINSGPSDNAGVLRPEDQRNIVVGFAQFFLSGPFSKAGNQPWCAEYIGPGALLITSSNTGAGGNSQGAYLVRLVE